MKFYAFFGANAKQLAWEPTCKKKLFADYAFLASNNGVSSSTNKKLLRARVEILRKVSIPIKAIDGSHNWDDKRNNWFDAVRSHF